MEIRLGSKEEYFFRIKRVSNPMVEEKVVQFVGANTGFGGLDFLIVFA